MPSELETAMESLITVFHRYASKDGRSGTLSRRELRELMENELSNFLQVRRSKGATFQTPNTSTLLTLSCRFTPVSLSPQRSLRRTPQQSTKS